MSAILLPDRQHHLPGIGELERVGDEVPEDAIQLDAATVTRSATWRSISTRKVSPCSRARPDQRRSIPGQETAEIEAGGRG